jgi:hypothetical protein
MHKLKKELPPEQCEKLIRTLKDRFDKNLNRHKGFEWARVEARLEANNEKLWSLNEMERTGGHPDVVCHDKKRANTFSMIVQWKVPKAAEVFVTIVKGRRRGKHSNQEITLLTWQLQWALSC